MTRSLGSLEDLVSWVHHHPTARIIGLVGAPGSGKSTLAAQLADALGPESIVVPMDGFHYPQATLVELGRRDRMGAPDTFDSAGLGAKLSLVAARTSTVWFPDFNRTIEEPVEDHIEVTPDHRFVIVEGNYLLFDTDGWDVVGKALDASIYLEIPEDLRLQRLIARHIEFGKTPQDAREWVNAVDIANGEMVKKSSPRADVTVSLSSEG